MIPLATVVVLAIAGIVGAAAVLVFAAAGGARRPTPHPWRVAEGEAGEFPAVRREGLQTRRE